MKRTIMKRKFLFYFVINTFSFCRIRPHQSEVFSYVLEQPYKSQHTSIFPIFPLGKIEAPSTAVKITDKIFMSRCLSPLLKHISIGIPSNINLTYGVKETSFSSTKHYSIHQSIILFQDVCLTTVS